jgi:hypothetical protein
VGKFQKGQSGNPGGRSRGVAEMARLIRTETRDGAELVEYALKVFRDPEASERSRVDMHAWLSDRGFGKPLQSVEIGSGEVKPVDLSSLNLTTEQLEQLAALDDGSSDGIQ